MTDDRKKSRRVTVSKTNSDQFIGRVRLIIGDKSVRNFAQSAGLNPSTLQATLEGRRPGLDTLVAIARAGGVTVDWLATGEGPMRPEEQAPAARAMMEAPAAYGADDLPDGFVLLPKYDVRASAGGGAIVHSEQIVDHLAFKRDWIVHQLRRNPSTLILIEAVGDSMAPTISNRDLLLVDTAVELRDNAIYVVSANGSLLVKRIQHQKRGALLVICDNPAYGAVEYSADELDDLHIVGQVVWHGGVV